MATIQMTTAEMTEEALRAKGTILVDFWAPWCGPCRMVGPVLEALSDEYAGKLTIGKLNVDENTDTAVALGVASIPTMILFKDGVEAERVVGAMPKPALQQFIDRNL